MKKILYTTLIALAGLFAASCAQEHIEAVYNPDKVTAQTLGEIAGCELSEDGENIVTAFNPVDFGMNVAVKYTLYASYSQYFEERSTMASTISVVDGKGTVSITQKAVNSMVYALGGEAGVPFTVYFMLSAAIASDKSNAIESTTQDSNVISAEFTPYSVDIRDVDLYEHVWVIGASAAVGAWSFDKVYQYLYDYNKTGNTFTGVIDFGEEGPSGGFKFTGVGNWDDATKNWGSEAQAEEAEAATIQLVAGGGSKDIKCYSKRFYGFSYNTSSLVLTRTYGFDNIGMVGTINDWNPADANLKMTYNAYYHRFYIDYTFASDAQVKFTCDDAWDLNFGKDCVPGGDNIDVTSGSYRVYVDLNKKTVEFSTSMFGKEEPGAPEPGPEPEPTYEGWGIIGDFNEWSGDVAMTEKDGVWTGYINVTAEQGWKLRKDAAWDENMGGDFVALGTPVTAVAGGNNICIGQDGFFKVVYDTNAGTIVVAEGNVWSLIGGFNEWAGDVDMEEVEGKWVASDVALSGEWKLRYNHDWVENRGGVFESLGTAFAVTNGGENINCGEGKFNIVYDPSSETVTVTNAAKTWGVIGDFTGWATDIVMTEVAPGIWMSPKTTISDGGWKVRFDSGWEVNYGGNTPAEVGQFVQAVGGGDNITIHGDLVVVLNLNNGTIGTLGWGLTGSIASCPNIAWSNDIPMNLTTEGLWVSCPIALATTDEVKIRFGAGWDQNFGGTCAEINVPFEAEAGGANIKVPADGTYVIIYNPAENQISVTSGFCGLIGDFNSWASDDFMLYGGDGKWYAFNRHYEGGWKIRMSAGWDVNRGGKYAWNTPFAVEQDGDNIVVTDEGVPVAGFNVIYDSVAETVTINQEKVL